MHFTSYIHLHLEKSIGMVSKNYPIINTNKRAENKTFICWKRLALCCMLCAVATQISLYLSISQEGQSFSQNLQMGHLSADFAGLYQIKYSIHRRISGLLPALFSDILQFFSLSTHLLDWHWYLLFLCALAGSRVALVRWCWHDPSILSCISADEKETGEQNAHTHTRTTQTHRDPHYIMGGRYCCSNSWRNSSCLNFLTRLAITVCASVALNTCAHCITCCRTVLLIRHMVFGARSAIRAPVEIAVIVVREEAISTCRTLSIRLLVFAVL